jgi:hypothetical protein
MAICVQSTQCTLCKVQEGNTHTAGRQYAHGCINPPITLLVLPVTGSLVLPPYVHMPVWCNPHTMHATLPLIITQNGTFSRHQLATWL